jgi:TetR/AcrR family transcriptional regulator, transcriptional repressor of aconitase
MPKVSEEHLERRRQQILDAAKQCFATKGFHNTSMQDIFAASGLSAGAVYRYFPSKHSLIQAIAKETLDSVLAPPVEGETPKDIADILTTMFTGLAPEGSLTERSAIAIQVWAEAARDPEMAAFSREMLGRLMDRIRSWLPVGTPPEMPRLVLAMLQGFTVQDAVLGDVTPKLISDSVHAALG